MDPYSQLSQLHKSLEAMTKTVAGLENDILEALKENTELKVENQLLREKVNKLTANSEATETKSRSGLDSLRQIYDSGYHICNMYYGSHRAASSDCMFCLDILDHFVARASSGKKGKHAGTK